nr:PREDICTED: 39S ribosomal protein L3, mitochondrial isoform X1 [Bemisia tabaci]
MNFFKNVCNSLIKPVLPVNSSHQLNLLSSVQQVRGTKKYVRPLRIRYPMWFLRQNRAKTIENLTKDNKAFIQEVICDKFGLENIEGGTPTCVSLSPLKSDPAVYTEKWRPGTRRVGLIVRKIGVYPMWQKDGTQIATTLFQVADNHVIKYIPPNEFEPVRKRYRVKQREMGAVIVGADSTDPQKFTKEYCGLFDAAGVLPKNKLCRFIVSPEAALQAGTPLYASHFRVGDIVDIRGKTISRGFQGVVRRWGFRGQPKTHGSTKTHNRPGNIGGGGEKARVWPGKKLPGHMGNKWRLLKGQEIVRINTKYNVIYIRGQASPGNVGDLMYMFDTILPLRRRKADEAPPFPTFFPHKLEEALPDDLYIDDMHQFNEPTIQYEPEKVEKKKK